MDERKFDQVRKHIHPEHGVPDGFFESSNGDSCIFLVSCLNNEPVVFLEDSFERLTGLPMDFLSEKGLNAWFQFIHSDDMPRVTKKIIESHRLLASPNFPRPFPPLVLDYRFQVAGGTWSTIRETKLLLLMEGQTVVDKVLCKLEFNRQTAEQKSCSKLLDTAMSYRDGTNKTDKSQSVASLITDRELEILRLIARGLSTKMIADKCCISINTVETHRRRLLEKLNVKNSMELIKEASKRYSLD